MSLSCGHSKTLSLISTRGQPTKYSIETVMVVAGAPSSGVTLVIRGAHDKLATARITTDKKKDILKLTSSRRMIRVPFGPPCESVKPSVGFLAYALDCLLPCLVPFLCSKTFQNRSNRAAL